MDSLLALGVMENRLYVLIQFFFVDAKMYRLIFMWVFLSLLNHMDLLEIMLDAYFSFIS